VFFTAVGEPMETTYLPYNRWTEVLETLPDIRRRKPYNARHSYSSRRLMSGHYRLLVTTTVPTRVITTAGAIAKAR
jgi:hypothetical protein